MGWSEQYWEDVKSELEESAAALGPTSEGEAPDPSVTGRCGDTAEEESPAL